MPVTFMQDPASTSLNGHAAPRNSVVWDGLAGCWTLGSALTELSRGQLIELCPYDHNPLQAHVQLRKLKPPGHDH